jgi:DNA-directed RNA polymerase subunit M/transcription elongation factor TFIIS
MYYIQIEESTDELIYNCRKCGHKNSDLVNDLDNLCVSKTDLKKDTSSIENIINQYTKLDPTLPRINTIDCPNDACLSNIPDGGSDESKSGDTAPTSFQKEKEIIYLRYDDTNMKFVYLCCVCDHAWKIKQK